MYQLYNTWVVASHFSTSPNYNKQKTETEKEIKYEPSKFGHFFIFKFYCLSQLTQ